MIYQFLTRNMANQPDSSSVNLGRAKKANPTGEPLFMVFPSVLEGVGRTGFEPVKA